MIRLSLPARRGWRPGNRFASTISQFSELADVSARLVVGIRLRDRSYSLVVFRERPIEDGDPT